jgi:hypothetical protein
MALEMTSSSELVPLGAWLLVPSAAVSGQHDDSLSSGCNVLSSCNQAHELVLRP